MNMNPNIRKLNLEFKDRIASGCYGTVYPDPDDATRVIKVGEVCADIEFYEMFYPVMPELFPTYYGVVDTFYDERPRGTNEVVRKEGQGLCIERLEYTLGEVIGLGLIPFEEIIKKVNAIETKLCKFFEETRSVTPDGLGIVIDDLHVGNFMFDKNFELKVVDVGVWFSATSVDYVDTHVWHDLQDENYGNQDFLRENQAWGTRFNPRYQLQQQTGGIN